MLFIAGSKVDYDQLSNLDIGLGIENVQGTTNTSAVFDNSFSLFKVRQELQGQLIQYPPLTSPFSSKYELSNSCEILLKQQIGLAKTEYPLLGFNKTPDHKIGFLIGEGIWRWRLFDYADNKNHDNTNAIFTKVIQYLASKEDKSFFRVNCKNSFNENEPILFNAEVYNKSYELVTNPDVTIIVTNDKGERVQLQF